MEQINPVVAEKNEIENRDWAKFTANRQFWNIRILNKEHNQVYPKWNTHQKEKAFYWDLETKTQVKVHRELRKGNSKKTKLTAVIEHF